MLCEPHNHVHWSGSDSVLEIDVVVCSFLWLYPRRVFVAEMYNYAGNDDCAILCEPKQHGLWRKCMYLSIK